MSIVQISCIVGASDPTTNLGLEVWIDTNKVFDNENFAHTSLPLSWDLLDDDSEHELRFVLKNKTQAHTKLDEHSNIIKDANITITKLSFDEIELNQLFFDKAEYAHDYNNTKPPVIEKFYGTMGCNGTVSLKFTTPIYLWLLENM